MPADALAPAPPTVPGEIIDAHTHVFTVGLLQEMVDSMPEAPEGFRKGLKRRQWGRRANVLPDLTPAEAATWYVGRVRDAGIARAVVMAIALDNQWTREFLTAANGHVVAATHLDPRDPASIPLLEREAEFGFRGVKLMPVNRGYALSAPACAPFFDKLGELGLPATIHYGVSVDSTSDLRFASPIDLSPVARDHPETQFVIAHFGAGWLPDVLRLAYQCKNVCVDTSGTNNWLDSFVPKMTLPEVFEAALIALGPERILFGTDSGTTAPYREWIAFSQRRILEELGLSDGDRDLILRGNAARIFGL